MPVWAVVVFGRKKKTKPGQFLYQSQPKADCPLASPPPRRGKALA
jgi:hypothetical protein